MHFKSVGLAIKNKNKTISFMVPAKNEEEHIGRCLDSLLAAIKDRDDCEIIVIDKGSTDATIDIAHSKGDRLLHPPNSCSMFKRR